ncbi:MAG: hypothetical protein HY040_17400 [Planctomycetes bacterium]|nr:hypothetical protein [Planctomycetota bacterium]
MDNIQQPTPCVVGSSSSWPPLAFHWQEPEDPLPVRVIRAPRTLPNQNAMPDIPPWLDTGPADRPFDFTRHVRRLLEDIVARCDHFAHIQLERVLIGAFGARTNGVHGVQARVTPLRFAGGQLVRQRRGCHFQVQRYFLGDLEFLYLMSFCLPRFLNQDFDSKFITLFHELHHIGPEFNGDLRRHHGRYHVHTGSRKHYDRLMADLARTYLAGKPNPDLHAFIRLNFCQLHDKHGAVHGVVVPRPKVIPLFGFMPVAASEP